MVDGLLRPSGRFRIGNLVGKSELVKQFGHVLDTVPNLKMFENNMSDSLRIPTLVGETRCDGSGLDDSLEFLELFLCQKGLSTGPTLTGEGGDAVGVDFFLPAFDGGESRSGDFDDFVDVVTVQKQLAALQATNRLRRYTSVFCNHTVLYA